MNLLKNKIRTSFKNLRLYLLYNKETDWEQIETLIEEISDNESYEYYRNWLKKFEKLAGNDEKNEWVYYRFLFPVYEYIFQIKPELFTNYYQKWIVNTHRIEKEHVFTKEIMQNKSWQQPTAESIKKLNQLIGEGISLTREIAEKDGRISPIFFNEIIEDLERFRLIIYFHTNNI